MKRSPLRRVSRRKAAADRVYARNRLQALERDQWTCQLAVRMDGHHCTGRLHVHHIRLRSQGGSHDPDNLVTLCGGPGAGNAHDWVHNNPAEAALFGLIDMRKDGGAVAGGAA